MIDVFKLIHRGRSIYWKMLSTLLFPRLFGEFGRGSVLSKPLQVRGARHIGIGANVKIAPYAWLFAMDIPSSKERILSIGDNVYIGHFAHIAAVKQVKICNNVLIADKVYISDHNHRFGIDVDVRYSGTVSRGPVLIGKGVWVGEGACILSGVEIGDGSVIGANAVVTKSVPPGSVVAGVAAKILRQYVDTEESEVSRRG